MPDLDINTANESEIADYVIHLAIPRLGLESLSRVREATEEREQRIQEGARATLLENFRKQAADLGISLESLFPGMRSRRRTTGNVAVKYRDPADASRVWSGRGMMAAWLRERQERGEDIEKYRVSETAKA